MAERLFREGEHTYEARREQLGNLVESTPDIVVIGSIGRCAILGYEPSVRTGYKDTLARDIDLTSVKLDVVAVGEEATEPFPLDYSFYNLFRPSASNGRVEVRYDEERPDIAVELPEEVFEPYVVEVGGVDIPTLHPDTMLNLQKVYGTRRPKDMRNIPQFKQELESVPYRSMSQDVFEPLDDLQLMIREDKATRKRQQVERLQEFYKERVPYPLRRLATPLLQSLKRASGMSSRNHEGIKVKERSPN